MRVLLQHLLRITNPHFLQHLQRTLADIRLAPIIVGRKGFGNLGSDPVERIKTGHRVLKDDAYLTAS